jgi:hypothetical protein
MMNSLGSSLIVISLVTYPMGLGLALGESFEAASLLGDALSSFIKRLMRLLESLLKPRNADIAESHRIVSSGSASKRK